MVWVKNYTQYGTTAKLIDHWWMKGMPAGDSMTVQSVTDNGSTANVTGVLEGTNGFTWAGVDAAFTDQHRTLSGATVASPVVCTTTAVHGLTDGDRVFITDVVGMTSLNNKAFVVDVLSTTTFGLYDVYGDAIDGTGYSAWSSGGTVTMKYEATATENVADTYVLTLGSGVIGANSDVLYIAAFKAPGSVINLGDIA